MRLLPTLPLCLLLFTVIAATAVADDGPPFKVRIDGPPRFAREGEIFAAEFVVTAAEDIVLENLSLEAPGWISAGWDAPAYLDLLRGESRRFRFEGRPPSAAARLELSADLEGGPPWARTIDLSREAYGGVLPIDSDAWPKHRHLPASRDGRKQPVELPKRVFDAVDAPPSPVFAKGTIRIYGEMLYYHELQDVFCPVNGAKMTIVCEVAGHPIHSETVDLGPDGLFDFQVPDVAQSYSLHTRTGNRAVNVEDPFWEADYIWSTPATDIPAGATQLLAGTIVPSSDSGGLHICSSLTYLHDYVELLGYGMPQVDVQWPEPNHGPSHYQSYFDEIHITEETTWSDATSFHEYGHYWNDQHAHFPDHDYCNMICDNNYPYECGHCRWCPEEERVMWKEGIAQTMRVIGLDHLQSLPMDYAVEDAGADDIPGAEHFHEGCPWIPERIEYVFAAIVNDMIDADVGTEDDIDDSLPTGDPTYDQLSIPPQAVLDILSMDCDVEGHRPYRFDAFLRCAAEWMDESPDPGHTRPNLWETVLNCGIDMDEEPPSPVTSINPSLTPGVPTQTAYLTVNWDEPADDMSGVYGYAIGWTEGAPAHPGDYVNTTGTVWSAGPLEPGTYYFTILPIDRAGRWGDGYTIAGPFIITDPGDADIAPNLPTGWDDILVLRTVPADPAPAAVTQSGYINPDNFYAYWGGVNEGTAFSGNFHDAIHFGLGEEYQGNTGAYGGGNAYTRREQGPLSLDLGGRRTLLLRYDDGNDVAESDEHDNGLVKQFVFGPPELLPGAGFQRGDTIWRYQYVGDISGEAWWNCHGYEIPLAIYPEMVWVEQDDWSDELYLRLYEHGTGQAAFRTSLHDIPTRDLELTVLLLSPTETGLYSYCVGVTGKYGGNEGYTIRREICTALAMPDSLYIEMAQDDQADLFALTNSTGQESWFSLKVASLAGRLRLNFFEPGFAMGDLWDRDECTTVYSGDERTLNVHLEDGEIALLIAQRERGASSSIHYELVATVRKADLAEDAPADWAGPVVPRPDSALDPTSDPIPAPTSLPGGAASTAVYCAVGNLSPEAGVPAGVDYEIRLDGQAIHAAQTTDPLEPGSRLTFAADGPFTVPGGRHTLALHLDTAGAVDEESETNNAFGRQWVWTPATLAIDDLSLMSEPPDPYGGFDAELTGRAAPNCAGFVYTVPRPLFVPRLWGGYVYGVTVDVDLMLAASADVDTGFTSALAASSISDDECDFVLALEPAGYLGSHCLGVTKGSKQGEGLYYLYTTASTGYWSDPIGGALSGELAAGTTLDLHRLSLPPGSYTLTLSSLDFRLGASLHDMDVGQSGRDTPLRGAVVAQDTDLSDASFDFEVPDPAPSTLALAIWRPVMNNHQGAADWTVTLTSPLSDVDETPAVTAPSLGAVPNPFNPATEVIYALAEAGVARLAVYDLGGRLVKVLAEGAQPAGRNTVTWRGEDRGGRRVGSGAYFLRLETSRGTVTKKVLLAK